MYNDIIRDTLKITPERARLVEAFLRLQYGTLDHLSRVDIRREYERGGISEAIDVDVQKALRLAESFEIAEVRKPLMKDNRRFRSGKPTYECGRCGKKTRETGEGESNVGLCRDCFLDAEVENGHVDNCEGGTFQNVETCPIHGPQLRRLKHSSNNGGSRS